MGCQPSKHKGKKEAPKDDSEQPPNHNNGNENDGEVHPVVDTQQPPNLQEDEDDDDEKPCGSEVQNKTTSDYCCNNYYYIYQVSYNNHFHGVSPSRKALARGDANHCPDSEWMDAAADSIFGPPALTLHSHQQTNT